MSGGSGSQQIKLFVFRPGFSTLSLHSASVSLPVTLCLSLYLSLPPLSVLFSSIFSVYRLFFCGNIQPPAPPLLNCFSPPSVFFSAPPFLCTFLCECACARCSMMSLVFADEACLCSLPTCMCELMYVHVAA